MPTKPERIYWDSCVYIDCIQKKQPRFAMLERIYDQAINGEVEFVASTLVLAEVVRCKELTIPAADQELVIRNFFKRSFFHFRPVDRLIAEEAAAISRAYPDLKPPDAIHIATAIRYSCTRLQTYDGECGGPKKMIAYSGRVGRPPLKIELPQLIGDHQPSLFDPPQRVDTNNNEHSASLSHLRSRPQIHPMRQVFSLSPATYRTLG
jgi:predicted nucleic acid-binding protein